MASTSVLRKYHQYCERTVDLVLQPQPNLSIAAIVEHAKVATMPRKWQCNFTGRTKSTRNPLVRVADYELLSSYGRAKRFQPGTPKGIQSTRIQLYLQENVGHQESVT